MNKRVIFSFKSQICRQTQADDAPSPDVRLLLETDRIQSSLLPSSTDRVRIDSIEFRIQDKKILGLRAASSFLSKVYNLKSEFKFIGI